MSYKKLRQTWRYQLLDYLDKRIGNNETFRRLKLWYYTKYTEGFYVHAPKFKKDQDEDDINDCVKYIDASIYLGPVKQRNVNKMKTVLINTDNRCNLY